MDSILMRLKKDEVRRVRQKMGLSQENMATDLELSQSQYCRIENGECATSYEKIIEISKILKVSPNDIIEFGEQFVFNNCSQSGKNNTIHNNQDFTEERKAYLEQIEYLKAQNAELMKIIQNTKYKTELTHRFSMF